MLEQLTIRDFALIDSATIEFSEGFTVLSGETGAGKSILIGALTFVLGGKGGVDQIRTGAEEAVVTASFLLEPSAVSVSDDEEPRSAAEWLSAHGIEPEDGRILLRRFIRSNGRTGAWIQGTPVTRTDMESFSAFLVDIHGQHEHQSLMRIPEHRRFLDSWAGITDEVAAFTRLYAELVEKRDKLGLITSSEAERSRRMDILSFSVNEISEAKLQSGEDRDLEEEETRLSSFEKLYSDIEEITGVFENDSGGIIQLLKKLRTAAGHAVQFDKAVAPLDSRIENAFYELSDIAEEFRSYSHGLVFDPDRLTSVQDRLALLYKLKKKYAASVSAPISEVIDFCEKSQKELADLGSSAADRTELAAQCEALSRQVYTAAKSISAKRKAAAGEMATGVEGVLAKLGMPDTKFAVTVTEKPGTDAEQKCGPYGMDDIEFLISANPGSPLQPLAKIASGGELSRVMLALKTILAENDTVDTLVFDEIDTGIGGEVAVAVGSHMKNLARKKQILCITHLASIAVYADNQIKVEKGIKENSMRTAVAAVTGEKRVAEIARMLSGDPAGAESLEHARVMLQKFSNQPAGNAAPDNLVFS